MMLGGWVCVFLKKYCNTLLFIFLLFKMLGFDIINLIFFCLYKKRKHKAKQIFFNITGDNKIFWRQNSNQFQLFIEIEV